MMQEKQINHINQTSSGVILRREAETEAAETVKTSAEKNSRHNQVFIN